jgi:hypothetical protein
MLNGKMTILLFDERMRNAHQEIKLLAISLYTFWCIPILQGKGQVGIGQLSWSMVQVVGLVINVSL